MRDELMKWWNYKGCYIICITVGTAALVAMFYLEYLYMLEHHII